MIYYKLLMRNLDRLTEALLNFKVGALNINQLKLLEKYSTQIGPEGITLDMAKIVQETGLPSKIVKARLFEETLPPSGTHRESIVSRLLGGVVTAKPRHYHHGRNIGTMLSGHRDG